MLESIDRQLSPYIEKLPGGHLTAGIIAALVAFSGLAFILFGGSGESNAALRLSAEDNPFYIEAEIVVLGVATGGAPRPEETVSSLQWWSARNDLWRWQLHVEPLDEEVRSLTGVGDGKDAWIYDALDNTYTRTPLKDGGNSSLPISVILGYVDIPTLTQQWTDAGLTVRSGGAGRHMNRDCQVIEYGPTWRSAGAGGDQSGGIGRIWIDDESGLVVRNLIDGGAANQYIDARVTYLELQPSVQRELFEFEAPVGAQQMTTP